MVNFNGSKNAGQQPQAGSGGAGTGGYASKLEQILAKAGQNNPIAKMQGKAPQQPTAQPPAAPAPAAQPPAARSPMPATPAPAPAAPAAPSAPQTPQDRLQQILAMAGQTPAQRAQSQAQQAQASAQANIAAMLQAYMQAVSQDPRKILRCDIEFSPNPGANTEIYFKCYADASGQVYWDAFGEDIDYTVSNTKIDGYGLIENYYRGVPDADFRADMATAKIHSHGVV